mmetsp:Transcript_21152/g.42440  ORF Transcript_21152/g.42440 Transcript_21152/m.42440 type:complete len:866 (+) Transcript_21152:164-2761(+)
MSSSSLQHHQQSNSNDEDDGTTNSHTSFPSSHSWASQHSNPNSIDYDRGGGGFPSAGSTFFADMTLDLHEAQMETTPRTDTKFASMAAAGSGGRGRIGGPSKEEIMQNVPPMPLIGEGSSFDTEDNNIEHNNTAISSAGGTLSPVAELQEEERVFTRITSGGIARGGGSSGSAGFDYNNNDTVNNNNSTPSSSPRQHQPTTRRRTLTNNRTRPYPRDLPYTAAFSILLPLGLFLPHFYYSNHYIEHHNKCDFVENCTPNHASISQMALSTSSHSTILLSTFAATILSIALLQLLYLHPGGGDGDDVRHCNVTRTLLLSANLSVWMNPVLAFMIWWWLPNARKMVVLPFALMVRDVWWRAKKTGSALPSFRRRGNNNVQQQRSSRGGGGTSASSSHDRKTFFRALACAALDILSRSLRRKSFVRVASVVLLVQFIVVSIWWGALSVILSVEIFQEDGVLTKFMHRVWLLAALVAGKWATGTVARLLGFVASGGVASWFAQQSVIIEEMRARQQQQLQQEVEMAAIGDNSNEEESSLNDQDHNNTPAATADGDTPSDYNANRAAARAARHAMPEAYRMADASAYSSMHFDDGLDDDYDDDDDDYDFDIRNNASTSPSSQSTSTVKSFLTAGCTFSFGSVAQCGLVGGLAQILWSVVRNIDAAGFFLQRRFSNSSAMRRMDISINSSGGGGGGGLPTNARQWKQTLAYWWRRLDVAIRGFVRSHSDLAMSHVAADYKTYQRAANDVAALIETSGVESIIHDDITTQMCSALGHVVSGSIVIVFGTLLATHRNTFASEPLSDYSLFEILLASYFLCYCITFTALEPLRAAIKAVYVCFAEHPLSLSQAFPLIFQRLSRISEASGNSSVV